MSGIYLEPLSVSVETHLQGFHSMCSDPPSVKWLFIEPTSSLEESKAWMITRLPTPENPDIDKLAVMLPNHNSPNEPAKMIGLVGTNRYSPQGLETGYMLHSSYWGRGYGKEAFKEFLKWFWALETRKNIMVLVAKIAPENVASEKIVKGAGARKGEVIENSFILKKNEENGNKSTIGCWYIDRPEKVSEGSKIVRMRGGE
ncbi:hypothetical protein BP5796_10127 [Coleophoma crateriformis]|uniref:N-acetyltransferase domain-containing protein n=1 Tax=Coleophoma crateriformis TaxID=565419 RepID=A0A3D8QUI9_9HELO|nr:hypothetical protein BP5796_10127 [Coleophoma crateriformis]